MVVTFMYKGPFYLPSAMWAKLFASNGPCSCIGAYGVGFKVEGLGLKVKG